jgi:hypothetical protein
MNILLSFGGDTVFEGRARFQTCATRTSIHDFSLTHDKGEKTGWSLSTAERKDAREKGSFLFFAEC